MKIEIGIADDHQLFLKSLSTLVESFDNYEVVVDALNGQLLLEKLALLKTLPEIVLLDVSMPIMNGKETAMAISKKYPEIKMIALSMKDDDVSVINMIKAGCCAYLLKDIHPDHLENALESVHKTGYYNADLSGARFRKLLMKDEADKVQFTAKELRFLKLATSDLTYKQIASEMHLSERTIDGYRESLFMKLNVQSRVGMVLEALRKNLVQL